MLISMLILLIVLLGLLQGLAIYSVHNINVLLRQEAAKVAQFCANTLRSNSNCPNSISRIIRNFNVIYHLTVTKTNVNDDLELANIIVTYSYKNQNHTYNLQTVLSKK